MEQTETKLLTYRGHIRNHEELCAQLGVEHSLPREEREKATVLAAYKKWGSDMGEHIYGMFALAIKSGDEIFCIRDQFGTKPFYYYLADDGELLFGTFIKDIASSPKFRKEINRDMLQIYLSLTYVAGEDTFFKGVKKLMLGHYLVTLTLPFLYTR